MSDISNLSDTIIPKSDQLNAEQLLGGPITIRVTGVSRGGDEKQPIIVHYEGDAGRPYKPCKSMRKALIFAWGADGRQWAGKYATLYNDPSVMYGGVQVGGIRISHLSDIERDIALSLTSTKGKKNQVIIKRLVIEDPAIAAKAALTKAAHQGLAALQNAWRNTAPDIRARIDPNGCPDALKSIAAAADQAAASAEN